MVLFYNRNHRIRFIAWLLFVSHFINCSIVESSFANSQLKQHRKSHVPPVFRWADQQQSQQPPSALHQSTVPSLPCVPTLDAAGLLPPSMYFDTSVTNSTIIENNEIVHKPTCRIQISWDISLPQQQPVTSVRGGEMIEITREDVCTMVSNVQRSLDHGLTTFQLKPYTSVANQLQYDIYRALIDTTPKSILDQQSQIIIPFRLEDVVKENTDSTTSATQSISTKSVRSHLLALLDRLGTDCIDNLQIQFPTSMVHDNDGRQQPVSTKNNHLTSVVGYDPTKTQSNNQRLDDRYYFDLIYQLQELVREGYIRSISSKDLSSTMHQHIQNNQLHTLLNTNQMDVNLCRISPLYKTSPPTTGHNSRNPDSSCYIPQHFIASNPLAGGWLVDRYHPGPPSQHQHLRPKHAYASANWFRTLPRKEQWNWDQNIVQSWIMSTPRRRNSKAGSDAGHFDFDAIWNIYQNDLMTPLRDMAQKHGVSVASVVLRWTLQQHEQAPSPSTKAGHRNAVCSSTVVSCRLLPEQMYWDTHRPFSTVMDRLQQIREVLRFSLDDEDIEQLWELSSNINPEPHLSFNENNNYYDGNAEPSSSGLFIPKRYKSDPTICVEELVIP